MRKLRVAKWTSGMVAFVTLAVFLFSMAMFLFVEDVHKVVEMRMVPPPPGIVVPEMPVVAPPKSLDPQVMVAIISGAFSLATTMLTVVLNRRDKNVG